MAKGTLILNFVGSSCKVLTGDFDKMRSRFFGILSLEDEFKFSSLRSICLKKGNRVVYFFEIHGNTWNPSGFA